MANEVDFEVLVEDFRVDLMLGTWVIFSHRSLVEGWDEAVVDLANELISELISRCDSRSHSKTLSSGQLARSSTTRRRRVITVVDDEVRPKSATPVMDTGK